VRDLQELAPAFIVAVIISFALNVPIKLNEPSLGGEFFLGTAGFFALFCILLSLDEDRIEEVACY